MTTKAQLITTHKADLRKQFAEIRSLQAEQRQLKVAYSNLKESLDDKDNALFRAKKREKELEDTQTANHFSMSIDEITIRSQSEELMAMHHLFDALSITRTIQRPETENTQPTQLTLSARMVQYLDSGLGVVLNK